MPKEDELMAETMPAGAVDAAAIPMVLKLVGASMSGAPLVVEVKTSTPAVFDPDSYPAAKDPE
jgi:hypothetical protein